MLYVILVATVLDFLYFKFKYSTPKGPPTWYGFPFVGLLPLLLLPRVLFRPVYLYYVEKAPDLIITRIFGAVLLSKKAASKMIYLNEQCQSKPELKVMSFLGWMMTGQYGMVYTDGGNFDWRSHRKIDAAALYALPKREMVARSSEVVDVFLREIEKHEGEVWDCEEELAVSKYQETANLNLGATFEDKNIRAFVKCVVNVFRSIWLVSMLVTVFPLGTIQWFESFFPRVIRPTLVARVYKKALWSLIRERVGGGGDDRARDFVQATLRVKEPEEAYKYLCRSALLLMVANTHSTHHTILSALTSLAINPDIQKKLHKEVSTVVGHEKLTPDHLDQMPYLKAIVMEINRLDSPFPFNLRYCTAPTNVYGYDIPGEISVTMLVNAENWDPVHFPQPFMFRPERFIDENGKYQRDPNIGVFGGGKRECPGKYINATTASVFISKIVQHYEVLPVDAASQPPDRIRSMFPAPAKVPFRFIRRDKEFALPTTKPSTALSSVLERVLGSV